MENTRHKACNACRERKIKCDGGQPKCRRCARNGTDCFYAPPSKRYCKADFASMLEHLNHRVLQAEAAAVTAQNAARGPLPSPAPLMPTMWSPFDPSSIQANAFMDNEYAAFSMSDLSPGTRASSLMAATPLNGNFAFPDLAADFSGSGGMIGTEGAAKHFDFNAGATNFGLARSSNSPNNGLAVLTNQEMGGGQSLTTAADATMYTGPGTVAKDKSPTDRTDDQHGLSNSAQEYSAENQFDMAQSTEAAGYTKERFMQAMNADWPHSHAVNQGPTEPEFGGAGSSIGTGGSPTDQNRSSRNPQPAPSTTESTRTSRHSSRLSTGDSLDSFESSSQSSVSASEMTTQSKRRRLDSAYEWQRSVESSDDSGKFSARGRPSSSRRSPDKEVDDALPGHLGDESASPSDDIQAPTPCSSSMRRNIGSGTSFQGIPKLQGIENYQEWVRAVRAAARKEGVWDMMMGVCRRPTPPKPGAPLAAQQQYNDDLVYWSNKAELALGGIEGSLSEVVSASVDNIECPRAMWLKLEKDFKPAEHKTLYTTMQKMNDLSLRSAGSVEKLANELRQMQKRLDSLTQSRKLPMWYYTVRFLLSLGPAYEEFVVSIISSDSNFAAEGDENSFERIVTKALAEEKRM